MVNTFGPIPVAQAQDFKLPAPGVMVYLSPPLNPPILKGIKVHFDNPFRFDFILDKGDSLLGNVQLRDESSKLIKYFLASITIPEKDLWVNLSPYEKDRIIPQSFGLTEMGRDLLAEDYMLKQITASLIYPEDTIGKKFWKRIYEDAQKKFGTTNIPVNTFNKVWIVPEKAVVYENAKAGTAYVVESKLKVMLEQDYLSLAKHEGIKSEQALPKGAANLGSQIVREIIIPELTKEVNENKNFAQLRQVYNSLILATWYKKKIKDSILSQVYSDKNKVAGVDINDPQEKEMIYQQYLKAFKKGVYNYIKEEKDPLTQTTIPRKYFSGGVPLFETENILKTETNESTVPQIASSDFVVQMRADAAMRSGSSDAPLQLQGNKALLQRLWKALEGHISRIETPTKIYGKMHFDQQSLGISLTIDEDSEGRSHIVIYIETTDQKEIKIEDPKDQELLEKKILMLLQKFQTNDRDIIRFKEYSIRELGRKVRFQEEMSLKKVKYHKLAQNETASRSDMLKELDRLLNTPYSELREASLDRVQTLLVALGHEPMYDIQSPRNEFPDIPKDPLNNITYLPNQGERMWFQTNQLKQGDVVYIQYVHSSERKEQKMRRTYRGRLTPRSFINLTQRNFILGEFENGEEFYCDAVHEIRSPQGLFKPFIHKGQGNPMHDVLDFIAQNGGDHELEIITEENVIVKEGIDKIVGEKVVILEPNTIENYDHLVYQNLRDGSIGITHKKDIKRIYKLDEVRKDVQNLPTHAFKEGDSITVLVEGAFYSGKIKKIYVQGAERRILVTVDNPPDPSRASIEVGFVERVAERAGAFIAGHREQEKWDAVKELYQMLKIKMILKDTDDLVIKFLVHLLSILVDDFLEFSKDNETLPDAEPDTEGIPPEILAEIAYITKHLTLDDLFEGIAEGNRTQFPVLNRIRALLSQEEIADMRKLNSSLKENKVILNERIKLAGINIHNPTRNVDFLPWYTGTNPWMVKEEDFEQLNIGKLPNSAFTMTGLYKRGSAVLTSFAERLDLAKALVKLRDGSKNIQSVLEKLDNLKDKIDGFSLAAREMIAETYLKGIVSLDEIRLIETLLGVLEKQQWGGLSKLLQVERDNPHQDNAMTGDLKKIVTGLDYYANDIETILEKNKDNEDKAFPRKAFIELKDMLIEAKKGISEEIDDRDIFKKLMRPYDLIYVLGESFKRFHVELSVSKYDNLLKGWARAIYAQYPEVSFALHLFLAKKWFGLAGAVPMVAEVHDLTHEQNSALEELSTKLDDIIRRNFTNLDLYDIDWRNVDTTIGADILFIPDMLREFDTASKRIEQDVSIRQEVADVLLGKDGYIARARAHLLAINELLAINAKPEFKKYHSLPKEYEWLMKMPDDWLLNRYNEIKEMRAKYESSGFAYLLSDKKTLIGGEAAKRIVDHTYGEEYSALKLELINKKLLPLDAAMNVKNTGGIDFTTNKTSLEIQNGGQGIRFHLDPAMLAQLQNAPGFVPVILNIQPLKDLSSFLETI